MTNRPLTAKEQSTIEFYCDTQSETFNNWAQSCLRAGYSKCKGWEGNARRIRTKEAVMAGIEAYKAKKQAGTARTVQSIDSMYQAAYDLAESTKQSSSMVSACTGIARLYGMDKDTQTAIDQPQALTPEQHQQALEASNRQLDVKLSTKQATG